MNNPLLQADTLPAFSRIRPEHVQPAISLIIDENLKSIEALLEAGEKPSWESLAAPLERLDDRLNRAWSPVGHLNSVVNSEELREAYNACLPLLSDYATLVSQNEKLYRAYRELAESAEFEKLDTAQRRIIENALRDFRLSGVDLPADKKARYKQIALECSQLASNFQDKLMDATQAWSRHVEDRALLAGLPVP